LFAHSYNWYGMEAQEVLIVKILFLRQLDWSLLRYEGAKLMPGRLDQGGFWQRKSTLKQDLFDLYSWNLYFKKKDHTTLSYTASKGPMKFVLKNYFHH